MPQYNPDPRTDATPSNIVSINEKRAAYVVMTNVEATRTILGTLGASAYAVYAFLDTYCNEDAQAWIAITTIMEGTRLSKSTVQRAIKALIAGKWLTQAERKNRFGFVVGFTYTLQHHMTPSDKRGVSGGVTAGSEPVHERVKCAPEVNTKVNAKVSPRYTPDDAPEPSAETTARLAEFRNAYPAKRRSCNPREIALLWSELTEDEQDQAVTSVKAWATSEDWRKENGQYAPNIVKFLSDRRWECLPDGSTPRPNRPLTQAELAQRDYSDWYPYTYSLTEWRERRANGTLSEKGLLR